MENQEVIINPKLLDKIPKLNSWLPPDYIDEILRDVQVYLDYKNDWFSMGELGLMFKYKNSVELEDTIGSGFYLKNTKTTAFDLTLFCCAWKRNPERVSNAEGQKWAKKVGLLFDFEPVWEDTHNGLAEIDDANIVNAVYEFNYPKPRLYKKFKRGSILSFIPKGFFILPIKKYPFMNFWETPFLEKKTKPKKDDDLNETDRFFDDLASLFG